MDGFEEVAEAALDLRVTIGGTYSFQSACVLCHHCEALNITRSITGPLNIKVWDDVKILRVEVI